MTFQFRKSTGILGILMRYSENYVFKKEPSIICLRKNSIGMSSVILHTCLKVLEQIFDIHGNDSKTWIYYRIMRAFAAWLISILRENYFQIPKTMNFQNVNSFNFSLMVSMKITKKIQKYSSWFFNPLIYEKIAFQVQKSCIFIMGILRIAMYHSDLWR